MDSVKRVEIFAGSVIYVVTCSCGLNAEYVSLVAACERETEHVLPVSDTHTSTVRTYAELVK